MINNNEFIGEINIAIMKFDLVFYILMVMRCESSLIQLN